MGTKIKKRVQGRCTKVTEYSIEMGNGKWNITIVAVYRNCVTKMHELIIIMNSIQLIQTHENKSRDS